MASPILRAASANWNDLRRSQDYYSEGALLWLEVDALLRDLSQGKHSLDDFCKKFLGANRSEASGRCVRPARNRAGSQATRRLRLGRVFRAVM